jgi:hypothetical protein
MSCRMNSTVTTEAASDKAKAIPNPITSCVMLFTMSPHARVPLRIVLDRDG